MKMIFFLVIGALVAGTQVSANDMNLQQNGDSTRNRRSSHDVADASYFFYQQPDYPRDCKEIFEQCDEESSDGVYLIQPDSYMEPFAVYCNNTVDDGGWMVIQRRMDGGVDFNRDWNDYKQGFGFLHREFWLGNEKLAYITNQKDYELRIDFVSNSDDPYFAKYNLFRVSDEGTKYKLVGLGEYDSSSTVGHDAMDPHRGQPFSTRDRDNDGYSSYHCGSSYYNGWWFYGSNVNGYYCYNTGPNYLWSNRPYWYNFPGGIHNIQYIEMKIRPV
ncbi:fibrinogen-like protein A isoform X1 [Apostichopus japonicus]|uniref:fibrinogen-like protein A isoform X1 n=1 Tax=Stichopus japonicus TaxID=307972 RepID=UPI003AB5AB10